MPTPIFQPVIGSGFDAVMAQQGNWANFNRGVDEANLARQSQANREYNNWVAQVAALNREDAARQDQNLRADIAGTWDRAYRNRDLAAVERERKEQRSFAKESQERGIKARKDEFDAEMKLYETEEKKQNVILENWGKSFAPTVKQSLKAYKEAATEQEDALNQVTTLGGQLEQELADPTVRYNPRTFRLEPATRTTRIADEVLPKFNAANQRIAEATARYNLAQQRYKESLTHWNGVQRTAMQNSFTIDEEGNLYHPKLDKRFGDMMKEAGGEEQSTSTTGTATWTLPEWLGGGTWGGEGGAATLPGGAAAFQTPPAGLEQPPGTWPPTTGTAGPVAPVMPGPSPAFAPTPAVPTALPLPKTKAQMVKGQLYSTAKGPAIWDGEKFVLAR